MFLLPIAFLFPLATYLLILGMINRRRSPLMVPGTWDFVGVLFGASGFVLAGGWFLLHLLADRWQSLGAADSRAADATGRSPLIIWLLVGLYFLFLVLGVCYLLLQRRMYTAIYNISPRVFEHILIEVLDGKGFRWMRTGNRLIVQSADEKAPQAEVTSLTLYPSTIGFSVGLQWEHHSDLAEQAIRQELEQGLEHELNAIATRDNHISLWLVSPSFLMLVVIFCCLVLQVVLELWRT